MIFLFTENDYTIKFFQAKKWNTTVLLNINQRAKTIALSSLTYLNEQKPIQRDGKKVHQSHCAIIY